MAFNRKNFQLIGGQAGNTPKMWSYTTTDAAADLNTAAYFNGVSDIVKVGDLIYAITSTGTTVVAALYYVLSNAAGAVDVNDGTVLANTDSD
jgi:hypothetical protein